MGYHGFYDRIVSNFGSSLVPWRGRLQGDRMQASRSNDMMFVATEALIQDPEYSKESNGYQATPQLDGRNRISMGFIMFLLETRALRRTGRHGRTCQPMSM